jgi:hypothetical protein
VQTPIPHLQPKEESCHVSSELADLFSRYNISVRGQNVCVAGRLLNIEEFITYYKLRKTFCFLPKCGVITNIELVRLAEAIIMQDTRKIHREIKSRYPSDETATLHFIEAGLLQLSNRARKQLLSVGSISPQWIFQTIFIKNSNIWPKRQTRSRGIEELKAFQKNINDFVASGFANPQMNAKIALTNFFQNPILLPHSRAEGSDSGHPQTFAIVEYVLFGTNVLVRGAEKKIYHAFFTCKNPNEISPTKKGREIGLSAERIRQILISVSENAFTKLAFLSLPVFKSLERYHIDSSQKLIIIDENLTGLINKPDHVEFNSQFYGLALGQILAPTHFPLLSFSARHPEAKRPKPRYLKRSYLLSNEYRQLDFERMLQEIYLAAIITHNAERRIDITPLLYKERNSTPGADILKLCADILKYEFGVDTDFNYEVILAGKSKKGKPAFIL